MRDFPRKKRSSQYPRDSRRRFATTRAVLVQAYKSHFTVMSAADVSSAPGPSMSGKQRQRVVPDHECGIRKTERSVLVTRPAKICPTPGKRWNRLKEQGKVKSHPSSSRNANATPTQRRAVLPCLPRGFPPPFAFFDWGRRLKELRPAAEPVTQGCDVRNGVSGLDGQGGSDTRHLSGRNLLGVSDKALALVYYEASRITPAPFLPHVDHH
jgi:hypothetical protein